MRLNRKDKRILVVDGSENYRALVSKVLEDAGYEVAGAADGIEGLAKAKAMLPDLHLIILDLNLPKRKGIEVIREVRESDPGRGVGIVVVAEFLSDHMKQVLSEFGVTAFVNKYFALRDVLYQVDASLFPQHKDSRNSPRKLVNLPVNYWIGSELYLNQCYDLSTEGMFIVMTEDEPPEIGTRLIVRFWLPFSEKLISSEGEVKWRNRFGDAIKLTHPPGIGVQFTELPPEERKLIKEFLDRA